MCIFRRLSALIIGFLLLTGAALAQVDRGTITGIVSDQSGAVIQGVAITVTNTSTGVPTNVVTNESGVYSVPFLPVATYRLTAEKEGFKTFTQTNIIVSVGFTNRVDVALSVGSKTESVTVTAEAPLLERETSDTGTTVTSREIEDLPLVAIGGDQRSPAFFIQLSPGTSGRGSNNGGPGNNRTMDTQVSGSMVSSTTMMIDGADVPSQWEFEGDLRGLQIPPDAVGEFKLEATNAPAEYGRSGGGTASFEVKSGTNGVHGTAYEYVRNDDMDARNFFNPQASANKQNEYGVTAGGPIKKNKAFIFGWFDGFKLVSGVSSSGTATVPTAQMLNGDFTQFLDPHFGLKLYDPTTLTTCGPVICDNKILSQTSFSPISQKINPYFPKPNANLNSPLAPVNNFTSTVENPTSIKMYGFKGDYDANERNRISVLYDYGINLNPAIGAIPAPLGGGTWPTYNKTRNGRINLNTIVRSNLSNHATAAYNFWGGGTSLQSTYGGKSDWVDYLGLKGFDPGLKTQFPQIVIGYNGESFNGGGNEGVDDGHSTEFNDTLTWIKGKHTIKLGGEFLKGAGNDINSGRTAGWFEFSGSTTGLANQLSTTGIPFASYLLGYADRVQDTVYTAPNYARNAYAGAFIQDDFKITRKLTLNLGLRWDLYIPDYHKYGTKSWADPTLANPSAPGELGAMAYGFSAPLRSGAYTHHHNFAPKIGLAYSLNDKTVIRAAYGVYFAQGNDNRLDRGTYVQGYNVNPLIGSGNTQTPVFQWDGNCPSGVGCLGVFPTTGTGFVPSLTADAENGQSPYMTDPSDGVSPRAENYQIGVQRQLPGQVTLTVAFVGNTGVHLASLLMPTTQLPPQYLSYGNQLASDGTTPLLFAPVSDPLAQNILAGQPIDPATGHHSPFPGFEALYAGNASNSTLGKALSIRPQFAGLDRGYEGVATSTYNALQVKAEKRFSNGLTMLLSYAWSKNLTNGGSIFGVFSSEFGANDVWNSHSQRGYGFNDMPQIASFSYVYDLPVGLGRHFLNQKGVVNQIIGGWRVSGIQQYQSGQPESIQDGVTSRGLEMMNGFNTPDTIPGVPEKTAAKASGHFDPAVNGEFNSAAFKYACQFCFGTMTPTEGTVRAFGYFDEDFSLLKDWTLHESWVLNFHIDAINAFNRVQFVGGQGSGGYANEPSVSGTQFGFLGGQGNPPRTIQLGMKLKW